jgi:hypothetical protein
MNQQVSDVMDELVPAFTDERGDWNDVLTRLDIERRVPRLGSARRRLVVLIGVIAVASAAALAITAPWSGTPTLLERAGAALAVKPGTILYERFETIETNPKSGNVTRHLTEIWLDSNGRFRALLRPGRGGTTDEFGRMGSGDQTLLFEPEINTIEDASFTFGLGDPVAAIKKAIATGKAIDAGKTTINGHTVEEIRSATTSDTSRIFVDPETFDPVEATTTADINGHQEPTVIRFLTYQHIPATPANLRLTNIKAEHPHAKLVLSSP